MIRESDKMSSGHSKGKRRLTALLAFICIFMLLLASCGGSSKAGYTHLEPDEAEEMISEGSCILVDCRDENAFSRSHIPGSINVPIESGDDTIEELLPDKEALTLVYCDYGGESKVFADHLAFDLGYSNINEFDGLAVWGGDLEHN